MSARQLFALALTVAGAAAVVFFTVRVPSVDTTEDAPTDCRPTGHWRAWEERVGGACSADRVAERRVVLDIEKLSGSGRTARWRFQLSRDDQDVVCSGIGRDERGCRWEIRCETEVPGPARLDHELAIELNPKGAFRGSNAVTWSGSDDACEARFLLDGERVSPEQIQD